MKQTDKKILSIVDQLKKIDDDLNNVLHKNDETIKRLEKEISEAQLKASEAEKDLAAAADSASVNDFKKAKERYNDAIDEIDLKKLMIERKRNTPLLTNNVAMINKETISQLVRNAEQYSAKQVYNLLLQAEEIRQDCITVSVIAKQMGRKIEGDIMHCDMGMSDFYPAFADRYQVRGLDGLRDLVEKQQ